MMFKFVLGSLIRTGIDLSRTFYRVNRLTGYRSIQYDLTPDWFDDDNWEEYSNEIIDAQIEKAVNAGQETLLGDDYFRKEAKDYCNESGSSYNSDDFISYIKGGLGDEKFNAINIIIEECSVELLEAHNDAFNFGNFSDLYNSNTMYGNYSNAAAAYSRSAAARYKTQNWYGSKAHLADKGKTITTFLRNNPGGRSRNQPGSPFAGRTTTQSRAVSRQTVKKFLAVNPRGTSR